MHADPGVCVYVCVLNFAFTDLFYWTVIKAGGSRVGVRRIFQILPIGQTHTETHKGKAFLMAPGTELLI